MLRPFVFPVSGGASYTNDWGGARSGEATGGTGRHQGTDMFAARGTPVVAVTDGKITKMGPSKIGGNRIWLNGTFYYAHLDGFAKGLKTGMTVKAGQVIGYVGDTGDAKGTPTHLHFGYSPDGSQGGSYANPFEMLKRWESGRPSLEPDPVVGTAAPTPATVQQPTVQPADLQFGQGVPTGPPMPGLPGAELPGSSEIPFRDPGSASELWRLIAPQSQEGRRFLELAGGTDAG